MSRLSQNEAAVRRVPVAHQRVASDVARVDPTTSRKRRISETRLQAGIAREHARDEGDPYDEVPCTD